MFCLLLTWSGSDVNLESSLVPTSKSFDAILIVNKRQRIPKGQSQMDNPEKLAT